MHFNNRYNEIFFMIDTCQAASMFQVILFVKNIEYKIIVEV